MCLYCYRPSLLDLVSGDQGETAGALQTSFELPSAKLSRKRHNSTASSRFFAGGWFSTSPTVPDELKTRTSLDMASGEFTRSQSSDGDHSMSGDFGNGASVAMEDSQDGEKKARWCTIM